MRRVACGLAGGGPDWRAAGRTAAEAQTAAAAAARDAAMALDEALGLRPGDLKFMGAAGLAHAMVGNTVVKPTMGIRRKIEPKVSIFTPTVIVPGLSYCMM